MGWDAGAVAGALLLVLPAAGLIAFGLLHKGRAVRPFAASRARSFAQREYARNLRRAADLVIAAARRAAGEGEPAIVTVEAVARTAEERYGYDGVERRHAAAALRSRYEHGRCAADCVTDAYG
ncbi:MULTISPECIES: hypothetical protein [unclassified Streptomyces]|uniref:hypothetical protein n=1 Tax=unclassified Streptomyces TaxID=2593676 RepID=UPI0006AF61E1|nr:MULTISPECIES: hypothetical protein [unclassified Streptomyces]KOX17594.1 hypothetical protein ADL06_32160 [Streptomyces sp. NRRL F-6491]KOX39882.1 hypothetical protein ADL08_24115 [Streptomyces sp. NRRL F-6492]